MKKLKSLSTDARLTLTFCLGLLLIPVFLNNGSDYLQKITGTYLKTFPSTYLFYAMPVFLTYFLSKKIKAKDSTPLLACTYLLLTVAVFLEFSYLSTSYLCTIFAILFLSTLCLNTNSVTASLVLLPGLLLRSLGTEYIFAAYIPVFLFMLIRIMSIKDEHKSERKTSILIMGAYLYISVFAIILAVKHKLRVSSEPVALAFSSAEDIAVFVSGIFLVAAASVLFVIRSLPVIRSGSAGEKISICLSAVYPLIFTATGLNINIISSKPETVFITALLLVAANNIHITSVYKDNIGPFVPEKHKNIIYGIMITVFYIFIF